MVGFKPFKTYDRAKKFAGNRPILRVGAIFLVPETDEMIDVKLTEIELLDDRGVVAGIVSFDHLNRLGNANHAEPEVKPSWVKRRRIFWPHNQECR